MLGPKTTLYYENNLKVTSQTLIRNTSPSFSLNIIAYDNNTLS